MVKAGRTGIVQLGEEEIKGHQAEALQFLKAAGKKDGERTFIKAWGDGSE